MISHGHQMSNAVLVGYVDIVRLKAMLHIELKPSQSLTVGELAFTAQTVDS